MKTKGIMMALLLFVTSTSFAQDWLDKLADYEDITQVTITKALLQMAPAKLLRPPLWYLLEVKLPPKRLSIFRAWCGRWPRRSAIPIPPLAWTAIQWRCWT